MQKEGTSIGTHDLRSLPGDLEEHAVDLQVETDELAQFKQGVYLPVPFAEDVFPYPILRPANRLPPVDMRPSLTCNRVLASLSSPNVYL